MHSLTFRVFNIMFGAKGIFTIEIKENIWEQLARGRFCLVNVVGLKTTKAIGKPKQLEFSFTLHKHVYKQIKIRQLGFKLLSRDP